MKKNFKRILSAALALVLLFTAFPAAFALGEKETDYTIVNPYEQVDWSEWKTYKANLHTHCDASDGEPTLDEMVEAYYKADYDILAMTDHGVITNGWTEKRKTNGIFNGFRKVYPMSKENYERITKGLDRGGRGMTDIRGGIECNMAVISKTHVNGYFTTYGQGEWGIENDYRTAPEEIEKAGGYSVLNHVGDWVDSGRFPQRSHWNVYIAYFAGIFIDCPSCLGMEIVNSTDRVTRGDRALWDELLQVVIPKGRNIWAFADDDSEKLNEVGRSFELFVLPENNENAVKKAMKDGNFFAASRYHKTTDGIGEFEGDGNVPLVTDIRVNKKENTITVTADPDRDCEVIEWIADGKVIATGNTIDLNDYEDELGCYIRFQMKGSGGVTYSQPFELRYSGRVDKPVPDWALWIFRTEPGQKFMKFYHSRTFALGALVAEKIRIFIEDKIKK